MKGLVRSGPHECERSIPNLGWNKDTSKLLGTADEHHCQKRTKDDLGYN